MKLGMAAMGALLMSGGAFLSYYVQTNGVPTPGFPSFNFASVQTPVQSIAQMFVPDPVATFGKSNLHVLLVGLDYDYDNLDNETSKSSRSDILMAINLDFKHHRISELSIPRDMVATMPNGQRAKINEAQSEGGINETKQVVADWLGLPGGFDKYVVLRIDTSKDLINAIGGIDINVMNSNALKKVGANGPLDYDDNWGHLHVHLKPGYQHLNGDEAVGYGRFRHDWCSDPCRIMRQQQVMRAVAQKIEKDKLNTLTHMRQILAVVHHDVDTNFTPKEELVAVSAFSHLNLADIRTAQVPYVDTVTLPDYGDSLVPDETAKHQLVAKYFPKETDATMTADAGTATSAQAAGAGDGTQTATTQVATTVGALKAAAKHAASTSAAASGSGSAGSSNSGMEGDDAPATANVDPSTSTLSNDATTTNGTGSVTAGGSSTDYATDGTAAAASNADNTTADATTGEPAPIHVRLENGTGTPGLAAKIASQLRAKGFVVDGISDADSSDFQTTEIHVDSTNQDASLRVRQALGQNAAAANIVPTDPNSTDNSTGGVTVVLGRDILGN